MPTIRLLDGLWLNGGYMNEDWANQLAAILGMQNQPPDDYWNMMAGGDQIKLPAAAQWGGPMMDEALRQMELGDKQPAQNQPQKSVQTGLATDKGGSAYKTMVEKQKQQEQLRKLRPDLFR